MTAGSMRLFVALVPPPAAADHVAAALAALHGEAAEIMRSLRALQPDRWHLTLTFCGEVGQRERADLEARLARAAGRHPAPALRLAGAGGFPRAARAQVLWIGLDGDLDRLGRIAASTGAAARRAGVPVEDRRFRGHVTVARARPVADLRTLVAALAGYTGPAWTPGELCLVRSRLGTGPAVYETVATWPLASAAPAPTPHVR